MRKSIQQMLMLAMCAVPPALAGAATLSVDEAKDVAAEFFQSGDVLRLADKEAFVLAHTATDEASTPICYIFNAKDGKGFVIVSADDASLPVIGYSDVSTWSVASVPASAQRVLLEPVKVSADTRRRVLARASAKSESKLLTTPSWSQEAPFNNMIPNRRLTGCVGVALAEILKYHGYPASRPASLVNAGEDSNYAWSDMRNDNYRSGYSEEEANAVAALVADAAIGIGTDFGMSSSSAYEVKVPYALTSLFGYDAGVSYKKRQEMSRDAWDQVIIDEIDSDRPVLYCGQDVSAGHAFVCDGYEMRGGSTPYFHINWGWGGSANGYYASDALNPVVSKAHSYNDLMTIVYNIKPATDATLWSDIHVTNDASQPGLTLNVSDISSVDSFSVRAGALKNISNSDFKGKISVALFDSAGKQKAILNDGRNFSLVALQISNYVDFNCSVPSGVTVDDGDVVRLVTQASGASDWYPVAGDLLVAGTVPAKGYDIPYVQVTLPKSGSLYTVEAPESQAILGRDFAFTLTPEVDGKVITVKANGFILTPDASNSYRLTNVLESQKVTVLVQNAADVLSKSTLWVTAGNLQSLLTEEECATVKDLTLYGTINVNDFNFMRDRMKLERLDISQVSILASGSNPANAIPTKAFMSYRSLKQIVLPKNLTTFKNACFGLTGLTSVDIPESVSNWEYNVFANCTSLKEVTVRRAAPVWINWCVFTNTPQAKLRVPTGASEAYKAKEYWKDFKEIVEELPSEPSEFIVKMAEKKGLKYIKITDEDYFWKGDPFEFKVETDSSFDDAVMMVYCNSTRLYPDAEGKYSTTINCNSLIHVEVQQPMPTTPDTTWKLTGDAGGIGLATDVVNVPVGKRFTVRANAIKVPQGDDAAKFYAMVLTTKEGFIKEFISSIQSNYYSRAAENLTCNFYCQVKDSKVSEGNQIRLATSYNKKDWQLVGAEADSICCSLAAIGNPVIYHKVTMPSSVTGAKIEGGASEVVRGMPFGIKVSAIDPAQRVTVGINGNIKAQNVAVANISVPAVLEDLDITIMVTDAEEGDYMVFNIQEGQLAEKLAECPTRVKLIGSMYVSDFDAIRENASTILDLDLADVTIKGAAMTGNSIPENAFAPKQSSSLCAIRSVILPNNLERISNNAFARCTQISEITIPAGVNYVGDGAFSSCEALKKIIAKPKASPACGKTSPFPSNPSSITLVVPKGSEESYSVPSYWWSLLSLYQAPVEHKDYYWVKLDRSRVGVNSYKGDINNVAVGQKDEVTMTLVLPNSQSKQFKPYDHVRPGVAFKVYDNGIDVFNNSSAYSMTGSGTPITPEQSWSMVGGLMLLRWNPEATSGVTMPQNHTIELNFYYDIKFENKEGANGVKAEIVEVPDGSEWENVPMRYFKYLHDNGWQQNPEIKPVLYKEGSVIKFQLSDIPDKTVPVVTLKTKVMTKTGYTPEYEEKEMTLEANGGIYTIPALEGDCWVSISGVSTFEEGDVIPAEYLDSMDEEEAVSYNELSVSGEMTEEEFEQVRENFVNVETIDLTGIENTSLPDNAFEGMDQLVDVIVSDNVTEIGSGCFKDCSSIESLTLPGVTSIGDGAFEGCENLTSILLPSLGASVESGKPGMRKAGEVVGVTAESFRGISPNCLIYIGENAIPGTEGLNIILNKDGQRVAASDIVLDGNHPFNAPASFMLGEHKISFTVDVASSLACDVNDGWTTIMLPFQPTSMEIGEKFADREGSGLHFLSFDDEESEVLTEQKEFLPNRPYLANVVAPFSSVPVTFSAAAREQEGDVKVYDVPFTPVPEETVAVGKEFSLYGSFDGQTRPVVCYMLNEEGSTFVRLSETPNTQAVKPFSAYLASNFSTDKTEVAVGEHPIWVVDPRAAGATGTHLFRSSKIELESLTKRASIYYTVDGTDPAQADGTRKLYTGPISMETEAMTINAIAQYKEFVSDPVVLNFELKKSKIDYALEGEWNWISHNVETPIAVSDFATSGIDGILSQTQEVIFDSKHGMIGSLTNLLPTEGYKVRLAGDSWNGSVAGVAFDPINSVKLHKGWNWIGTPVDEGSLLISDLFSSLEAEEGDILVGLDGFVEADSDGAWKGSVSHMVPGAGYMFFSNSDKEFVYNIVAATEAKAPAKAPVSAVDGYWNVDNHKYASVMPMIASLDVAGDIEDYVVAAFCGEECRGIGVMVDGLVMINIHGQIGDVISFRFIGNDNEEMVSPTTVAFEENPEGSFAAPFEIASANATAVTTVKVDSIGIAYEDGSFLLNGDFSGVKAVEIYDLSGKMIAKSTGERSLKVGNIDGSVVTVVIRKADSASSVKMIVK